MAGFTWRLWLVSFGEIDFRCRCHTVINLNKLQKTFGFYIL